VNIQNSKFAPVELDTNIWSLNVLRAIVDCSSAQTGADGLTARAVVFHSTNVIAMVIRAMKTSSETQLLSVRLRTAVNTFSNRISISSTVPSVEKFQPKL